MIIRGRIWKFGDDINTDLMFPPDAFLLTLDEQARMVFRNNRPGWVDLVRRGDLLVAGRNLGTGSARPGALLLKHLGIAGIAADSINGLFFRNCVSYGLAALACPGVSQAFEEGDTGVLDLLAGTARNERTGAVLIGTPLTAGMAETITAGGIQGLLKKQGFIDEGGAGAVGREREC